MKIHFEQLEEKVEAKYKPLRDKCLARVTRWVYATGPLFEFLPLENLWAGGQPGRETDSAGKARVKYGFDARGKLVYSVEDKSRKGASLNERFHIEEDGNTFLALFLVFPGTSKREPMAFLQGGFQQLVFAANGRLSQSIAPEDTLRYIWEGDRLTQIEHKGEDGDSLEEVLYDELGRVKGIWMTSRGKRRCLYKRPEEGVSLKSLEPLIRERLSAAVQRTAEKSGIKQPVYCLALAYDGEGNDVLPPCIGFGLESERRQWVQELGEDAKTMIWNPAEFTHYEKDHTQLDDKELSTACDLYNDLVRAKENFAPAVKLAVSVAADLAKVDWTSKLNVTRDFVVYAVDFELCDLNRNLKQTVPPLLAKLRKAKLL